MVIHINAAIVVPASIRIPNRRSEDCDWLDGRSEHGLLVKHHDGWMDGLFDGMDC